MQFTIPVLYSQLAFFSADLETPYNDWTDMHVAQGFAWRPKSVSFAIPDEFTELDIDLREVDQLPLGFAANRVIRVPLVVEGNRGAEFGNVIETVPVKLADGHYSILFQLYLTEKGSGVRAEISICPGDCTAAVLMADEKLDVPQTLLMDAQAAR